MSNVIYGASDCYDIRLEVGEGLVYQVCKLDKQSVVKNYYLGKHQVIRAEYRD